MSATGERCSVEVYSVSSGKKSPQAEVVPELTLKSGRWLFVNFDYGKSQSSADQNLVDTLKTHRVERQKYLK